MDAFEAALAGRTPENTLLSHDLFEGLFARTALVTDIELFEEFPSSYEVAASRQHRWARGDWQLLPWILRGRAAGNIPTRIPAIARWKMLDNLRRTLSAPAAVLTLVAGWTLPGSSRPSCPRSPSWFCRARASPRGFMSVPSRAAWRSADHSSPVISRSSRTRRG